MIDAESQSMRTIKKKWSRQQESNPWPADYKSAALPTELCRLTTTMGGASYRAEMQTQVLNKMEEKVGDLTRQRSPVLIRFAPHSGVSLHRYRRFETTAAEPLNDSIKETTVRRFITFI